MPTVPSDPNAAYAQATDPGLESYGQQYAGMPIGQAGDVAGRYQAAVEAGNQWNPVSGQFVRTPASAGSAVNEYNAAVLGGPSSTLNLQALLAAAGFVPPSTSGSAPAALSPSLAGLFSAAAQGK